MFFFFKFKLFKDKLDKPLLQLFRLLFWCLLLVVLFTILFKYIEQVSWDESFWQAWQTITTVGYGNRPAVTVLGRLITILISTIGIAVLGALFSSYFDYKNLKNLKKRLGYMTNPFKNGYVLVNFPGKAKLDKFIKELRHVEEKAMICIIDNQLDELPGHFQHFDSIHFIKGDPFKKSTLERANLTHNKIVVVFPTDPNNTQSDSATRTMIDLVHRFINPKKTRIIHILVSEENRWLFENLNSAEVPYNLEILSLVQECHDYCSSPIIEKLLSNTAGANPATIKISKKLDNWTWSQLLSKSLKVSFQYNMPCNFLAIAKSNYDVITCPHPDAILKEGNYLSVITYLDFDWEKFEHYLLAIED